MPSPMSPQVSIGLAEISAYTGASAILTPPPCCTDSQSCQTPRPSRGCFPASPPFLLLVLWVLSTRSVFGYSSAVAQGSLICCFDNGSLHPKFSDRSWWCAPLELDAETQALGSDTVVASPLPRSFFQIEYLDYMFVAADTRLEVVCPSLRFRVKNPKYPPSNPRLLPPFHALPWSN